MSSSNDFKQDILSDVKFGDTKETWERFIKNEEFKGRVETLGKVITKLKKKIFPKEKTLYFNDVHISRYDFDSAYRIKLSKIHTILLECWNYETIPSNNITERDKSLEKLRKLSNGKEENKMILDDLKRRFKIDLPEEMVESGVGASS